MTPLIEFKDFSFTYPARNFSGDNKPARALDSLSFRIDKGDFILIKGDSGSGKSSLILSLCGIIPHGTGGKIAGKLLIEGVDIRQTSPTQLSDLAGGAFQNPHNHHHSVLQIRFHRLGLEP